MLTVAPVTDARQFANQDGLSGLPPALSMAQVEKGAAAGSGGQLVPTASTQLQSISGGKIFCRNGEAAAQRHPVKVA